MTESCSPQERGARMVRDAGYTSGANGDIHTAAKRRAGGPIRGKAAAGRPDRRARGGATGDDIIDKVQPNDAQGNSNAASRLARGGKVGKKTVINIDASHKGDPAAEQMAHQKGMQDGARAIAAKLQGGAGGGPPPGAGGPPGGGMPPGPPMAPPGMGPPGGLPAGPPPGAGAMPSPGATPPHPPMMPPPGAGGGNPGMMRPPGMASGGPMRDAASGRYLGGGL